MRDPLGKPVEGQGRHSSSTSNRETGLSSPFVMGAPPRRVCGLSSRVVFFRKTRRRVAEEVRARLGESEILAIDDMANSFGVESAGVMQVRGNGCLAATSDEVLFIMWMPRKELSIPRAWIRAVERADSHLGKRIFRPLLRIRYTDDQGRADSVAFAVRDLPAWEAALSS